MITGPIVVWVAVHGPIKLHQATVAQLFLVQKAD